jgi:hypothetical protein
MNKESAYEFGLEDNSGRLQGAFGPGCWRWWGSVTIPLNIWTHVAVGQDGTNERHFVNGDFVEQDACSGSLTINDENFKIGARGGNGGHSSQFRGSVDEAMLFDSCLDEAGVAAVYGAFTQGMGSGSVSAIALPASLVGFWPLDGDGSDVSGHGLHGTVINEEWVTGLAGLAFYFDGDDAIACPAGPLLDLSSVLMMAWVMPTDVDVEHDRGIVMNKESSYEFGLEDNTGALQGALSPDCWRWWGTDIIPLNKWTHVGVGGDTVHERHFVNGVFTMEDACAGVLTPSADDLRIGARTDLWGTTPDRSDAKASDGHASQFKGSIDEVMLFSTCLSETEVAAVYDATYAAPSQSANIDLSSLPSGLVGYWPLDGPGGMAGNQAEDVGPNGLNGELSNAEFVMGRFGDAFFFSGDDAVLIAEAEGSHPLDVTAVLMMAWVMPSQYDVDADRGIVMNKESAYEFGLEDNSGRLQGAFGPGCWRWWGTLAVPLNIWTHVAVGQDGKNERHFINGQFVEQDACPGSLTINDENFKIGARGGNGGHSSQFRGSVDEAMLFDSCLDEAGVTNIFQAFAFTEYHYVEQHFKWHEALVNCESMGMTLASVHSTAESEYLQDAGDGIIGNCDPAAKGSYNGCSVGWIGLH